ncbi:glycoside hydrolase family 3 C-terminal domain-containing protein [Pseudochryseolinea flava]|uniref:Glycosyl hydrolase n=1 Tax=Pseudochryseolinea flava TaxID=2059302 RepID=A0A364Y273_9BACT|nr:glycoside hydrolase family 3 C-terminal domain-containing protein [Pseudochryseolinea flava]RAW00060.1 glycosyl hydrolase [Pseudochryseolinea flava]
MKNVFMVSALCGLLTACGAPEQHTAKSTEEKIDSLISELTIEEKVALIHSESSFASGGVKRLGIPHWVMSDGPHGVRKEHGTDYVPDEGVADSITYLPVGVALASTWNPELGYQYGEVLGSEANARGKDVILGPGINIIRTPVNGRNFEYLSEDPYLISKMVVGYIKGVQDQGISACVKHFAANNQETQRTQVDVYMSERALREIYLPGFKAAVQDAEVNTLMGAYNKFRGQYCTHNDYLVNTILKGEWGFKGVVMSDWGAVHNTMEAINNGTDVEMGTDLSLGSNPNYGKYFLGDTVVSLVNSGKVDVKIIDDKVRRILRMMYKTNMFGKRQSGAFNTKEHQATALKIAEEAIVLLKNDNILPLKRESVKTIAVIGANATRKHAGAGGSSQVNAKYEVTPLEGIQKLLGDKVVVKYAAGYEISKEAKANPALIQEAAKLAASADVVIYVGGWIHGFSDAWTDNAFDSEDTDKPNIILPFGQEELLKAVQKANAKNVVVLYGGAATDMNAWEKQAKAIVQAWYPGMEGGTALAKILFGETNPSGKLPMTFPKKLEDSPAHANGSYPGDKNNGWKAEYKEGIFVGYRYYDQNKVAPAYPFGYGLSYTTFEFGKASATKADGGNVVVKVTVKNTGKVAGAEVVQAYVSASETKIERAPKELKGFKKVFLQAGESKEVEITLDQNAFQYYDEATKSWATEKGRYTILIGNSSRNTPVTADTNF